MSESPATGIPHRPKSPNERAWSRFRNHRPAVFCGGFLTVLILVALLGPWISPYGADRVSADQFAKPSLTHWFGTDVHGRDLFTRLCVGARLSLVVGLAGAGVSLVIGVCWGMVAGYVGGKLDGVLMRIVDILYSLPGIVFVIVLITSLEGIAAGWLKGLGGDAAPWVRLLLLFAGLGAVSWLTMARIVRGQVLTLRNRAFVEASQALGASHVRILTRHILPNIIGVVIVYVTLTIPSVVLYESFLSYLGLGIRPPQASLGTLIAEGAAQINPIHTYWWLLFFPAGLLATSLMAMSLLGDGLRDALDPRADF